VTKEGLARLQRPIAAAIVILGLLGAAPCEGVLGDQSTSVVFVNGTSHRVIVYPVGHAYPSVKVRLDPGAEEPNNLLISSSKRETFVARVEATDEADTIVFCHEYTLGELQDLQGRIVVRDHELCVAR
jgi:hypothetical protein